MLIRRAYQADPTGVVAAPVSGTTPGSFLGIYEVGIGFTLDMSPVITDGSSITGVTPRVVMANGGTQTDVTATLLQGTVATSGLVHTLQLGNANAVANAVYTVTLVTALSNGESLQTELPPITGVS